MTKMPKTILKVKDLNVELDGQEIIKNLSFDVKKGEILTILGPNGAGKTVLLKTLLGLLHYKGEIRWAKGIRIGYVPQRIPFIREISLSIRDFFKLKFSHQNFGAVIKLVGLKENFLEKRIGDLSSGEFQRILVAWSLINDPEVLLFDEPTTGIDIGGEETIYSLLMRLKEEKDLTILLVTHDLSVVYKYSSNVLCLYKGKVCCLGKPKEILTPKILEKVYQTEVKFYEHKH